MSKASIRHRRKRMEKRFLQKKNAERDAIDASFFPLTSTKHACSRCGMCCNIYRIALTIDDIDREPMLDAASYPIKQSERERYYIDDKYHKIINTSGSSLRCHFYNDDSGCGIYESRPDICREYIPTLSNCLKARMGYAGFDIEEWSKHCITEYCKTLLHCNTGLHRLKDNKTVSLYSLIMPYLASEEKMISCHEMRKNMELIPADSRIERLIDYEAEIPDWIRGYLQLDHKYKTIWDIFKRHF